MENQGQWPDDVRFRAQVGGGLVWITDHSLVFDFYKVEHADQLTPYAVPEFASEARVQRGHVVAMRFDGARAAQALGRGQRTAMHHYIRGADPAGWIQHVPVYDEVLLEDLYEGIDLRVYNDGGLPRYDLLLDPSADLAQVRMQFDGPDDLALTETSTLQMATVLGPVEQRGLLAYQDDANGRRTVVESAFVLRADGTLGFETSALDEQLALVIDPLIWSRFLGGASVDYGQDIALGPDGNITVTGFTFSNDFPTTAGAYDTSFSNPEFGATTTDAFVTRIDGETGEVIWSTYYGTESASAGGAGVAAGTDGSVAVTGRAGSGLPTTPGAFDTT